MVEEEKYEKDCESEERSKKRRKELLRDYQKRKDFFEEREVELRRN